MSRVCSISCLVTLLFLSAAGADEPVRMKESFAAGQQFHIHSRMKGAGKFALPPEKDKQEPQSLTKLAESSIDYDERILENDDGLPNRVLRVYQKLEITKEIGKEKLESALREPVRRLVVLRDKSVKVPFSPDGPLTLAELELVRTDIFTPMLSGLLPADAVKPGDTWKASELAVRELTDMQVETGSLECKFVEATTIAGRKVAHVRFEGTVSGVSEDGPMRQEFNGRVYFDLESNHISYLSLAGRRHLLDKGGKSTGMIEGTLTITRQARISSPKLADEAIRGVRLTQDRENSLLMYENEDLGLRFQHPRRWRVARTEQGQVMIDADNGNGILLTVLPLKDVPSPAQFAREVEIFFKEQQGKILGTHPARRVQANPDVDYFGYEAEMKGQRIELDYYVARQRSGGATLAARLVPQDLKDLRSEVEAIARSIVLSK